MSAIRRAEPAETEGPESYSAEELQEGYEGDEAEADFEDTSRGLNSAQMLENWLGGEGASFKTPIKPNNWLGGDVVR